MKHQRSTTESFGAREVFCLQALMFGTYVTYNLYVCFFLSCTQTAGEKLMIFSL